MQQIATECTGLLGPGEVESKPLGLGPARVVPVGEIVPGRSRDASELELSIAHHDSRAKEHQQEGHDELPQVTDVHEPPACCSRATYRPQLRMSARHVLCLSVR